MIESKQEVSKDKSTSVLEKALQALEQAKQRVANEKKKQNEKKWKAQSPCVRQKKYSVCGVLFVFNISNSTGTIQRSYQYDYVLSA